MNEIVVNTVDGKSIEFLGQLIGQAEGDVEFTDGTERRFVLKLYEMDRGGFVPVIEYTSSSSVERSGCVAEQVDAVNDIEKCYSVFEPNEVLPKFSRMTREELNFRKQLSYRLSSTFDKLTSTVLDELDCFVEQHLDRAKDANPETVPSNGFWDLLRGKT